MNLKSELQRMNKKSERKCSSQKLNKQIKNPVCTASDRENVHLHHIKPLAEQGGGGGLKAGKMSRITQSRLLQVGRSRHRGVVQFAPATFIIVRCSREKKETSWLRDSRAIGLSTPTGSLARECSRGSGVE